MKNYTENYKKILAFAATICQTIKVLRMWRNGRRSRLKICRWQHRAGSSPAIRILKCLIFRGFQASLNLKHSNIVFVQKGGLQILLIPFFLLFFKIVLKKIQYFPFFLFFSFFQYKLKILFNFVFLVFILLIQSFFLCLTYKSLPYLFLCLISLNTS